MGPMRSWMVQLDRYAGGALGVVQTGDFWRASTGPDLLRDPAMANKLRARVLTDDWFRERDQLSLLYLSRILQGQDMRAVRMDPAARADVMGMVLAEGSPPAWWRDPASLRSQVATAPHGTFQMGLMNEDEAAEVVAAMIIEPVGLGLGEARAVLQAVSLHPGMLQVAELDALVRQWVRTQPLFAWSLEPVVAGRAALRDLALAAAPGGRVGVQIDDAALPSAARKRASAAVLGLLRSAGVDAVEGADLRVTLTMETREYGGIAFDRKVLQHRREKVRFYLGPDPQQQTLLLDRDSTEVSREAVRGRLRAPTLVIHARAAGRAVDLEAPPFGFARAGEGVGGVLLDATDPSERERLGLPAEADLLVSVWTWGTE